jgi:host factor-I protein
VDTKSPQNIQDAFLNTVRREKDSVTVYLMNGAKLTGRIKSFDKFSVLLESGSNEQLIFKHAISTIQHSRRPPGGGGDSRSHQQAHDQQASGEARPDAPPRPEG